MKTKRKILIVIAVLFAIALVVGLLTQVVCPLVVFPTKVECCSLETLDSLTDAVEDYNYGTLLSGEYAISFKGELPSQDPKDYVIVRCHFDVVNLSFIDQYGITARLTNAKKYSENVLFGCDAPIGCVTFRADYRSSYAVLDIYKGSLNDEQFEELIRGLEITVEGKGDFFGTKTKVISFKNIKDITIETVE